eukprot:3940541-Rhodomonas_salina.4
MAQYRTAHTRIPYLRVVLMRRMMREGRYLVTACGTNMGWAVTFVTACIQPRPPPALCSALLSLSSLPPPSSSPPAPTPRAFSVLDTM